MCDAVDRFTMKVARRERLVRLLNFWIEVRKQGLKPADVEAFGYEGKMDSESPFTLNYARLKDGSKVPLTPALRRVELVEVE